MFYPIPRYSFHIWAYDSIYKLDLNYKQRPKKGKKYGSKMDEKEVEKGNI